MTDPNLIEHSNGVTFVYFLAPIMPNREKMPDRIKIGITDDLRARKSALESSTGQELEYLWALAFEEREAARIVEADIHKEFKDFRLKGEWFKFCKTVVSIIPFFEYHGTQVLRREHLK